MRVAASLVFVALLTPLLHATTYIVPSDDRLIAVADAIVTGTILGSHARKAEGGMIETVTEVAVGEWIKGNGTAVVAIVLPGGQIGDEGLTVWGVPSFSRGERVLLFLDRNRRGDWTTWALALGAFRLGEQGMLTRAEEVFGWDVDGKQYVERVRLEREFVDYLRAVMRGEDVSADYFAESDVAATRRVQSQATFPIGSYSTIGNGRPLRRNAGGLRVAWRLSGTPGDLNLTEAVDIAIAAWNGRNPQIAYSRSPVPASGDRISNDSESRVIANDPHGEINDECCPNVAAKAYSWWSGGTHSFMGQTFRTITHSDIVLDDRLNSSTMPQAMFNDLLTHELGHTLGLRHANRSGENNDEPCGGNANCCINTDDGGHCESIMNSSLLPNGLQAWDRDAIACLYDGACTSACVAPSFLIKPASRIIYDGGQTVLAASVRATPPLSVQWYVGSSGDTSTPFPSGAWRVRIQPEASTNYWVRVTGACGSIDSETAAITTVRCPNAVITSASATIVAPGQVRLRATAAVGGAILYRWYRRDGPEAEVTLIGTTRDLTTKHVDGATYLLRVENPCGNSATSAEVTPSETPPPVRRRRSRP